MVGANLIKFAAYLADTAIMQNRCAMEKGPHGAMHE